MCLLIPWARFNIKMSSYQYRESHCGDKTVVRSSYLHNGISNTGKMTYLYWISPLVPCITWVCSYSSMPQLKSRFSLTTMVGREWMSNHTLIKSQDLITYPLSQKSMVLNQVVFFLGVNISLCHQSCSIIWNVDNWYLPLPEKKAWKLLTHYVLVCCKNIYGFAFCSIPWHRPTLLWLNSPSSAMRTYQLIEA